MEPKDSQSQVIVFGKTVVGWVVDFVDEPKGRYYFKHSAFA